MKKYKVGTRLTEINSMVIEQLRKEYNKIAPGKFSLSTAFKQHFLNERSYVVISKNTNALEFRRYNQIIVNLHTNLNRIDTADATVTKVISSAINKVLEVRVNTKPLLFDTLSIQTSRNPGAEVSINQPLFYDQFSKREKQYTISFSQEEFALYQKKLRALEEQDKSFSTQLHKFLNDFSVYQVIFSNSNISFANDEGLTKVCDYINRYVLENSTNETKLKEAVEYLITRIDIVDKKLMAGSTDLIELILG
ncbi:hypothetical protein QF043_005965 [Pseudomonas sp. W3I7]|uniref:hypothetical protein n=1 Tax=Pseudomonas sp. W3I7 TaxID=3042292 RepID=UPI0027935AD3|nr:hypothetical protein [Pseudomonas sp. W3I7]MDQ0707173.1 hypothetical protein [Pseudomonas sp. W3I7]